MSLFGNQFGYEMLGIKGIIPNHECMYQNYC